MEYPYHPVLDDFIPMERVNQWVDLGLRHIPLEFVAGTCTGVRTSTFALGVQIVNPRTKVYLA